MSYLDDFQDFIYKLYGCGWSGCLIVNQKGLYDMRLAQNFINQPIRCAWRTLRFIYQTASHSKFGLSHRSAVSTDQPLRAA
jgi:hypothetical protein